MTRRDDNTADDTRPARAAPPVSAPGNDPLDVGALADAVAEKLAERLAGLAQRRYLTVAHAAEYADLSTDSIRSLLAAGKLTGLRPVPGRVLIDRRELDALLRASTKRPRQGRGVYDRTGGEG